MSITEKLAQALQNVIDDMDCNDPNQSSLRDAKALLAEYDATPKQAEGGK